MARPTRASTLPIVRSVGISIWDPIWARLTPEAIYVSSLVGMAELLLSGCTTA